MSEFPSLFSPNLSLIGVFDYSSIRRADPNNNLIESIVLFTHEASKGGGTYFHLDIETV